MGAVRDINSARSMWAGEPAPKKRESREFDCEWALQELADTENEKNQMVGTWRAGIDLFMPNRQGFNGEKAGQPRIPQEKFDSAPEESVKRGLGNIIAALCPPGEQWCEAAAGAAFDDKEKERLSKGLEKISEITFDYINRSLFSTELHSGGKDMMVSTMFLTLDEGTPADPLRFRATSLDENFPVLGPNGELENNYRRYRCRPQHILRWWKAAKLGPRVQRLIDQKTLEKITIIEATTFEPGRGWRFTVFDPTDKHIFYDVEPDNPLGTSRCIRPRLDVFPESAYGCGPIITALATCRVLNKERELYLKGMAKRVAPPTLFDKRAAINPNTVRLGANMVGMFDGTALNGADPAYQIPGGADLNVCVEDIRENRAIIDDILFATQDIPPAEDFKGRTMYETQVRRQMVLAQRGVNLGRLQRELPNAVFTRSAEILGKFGLIPQLRLDGRVFAVKALGPIAAAQRAEKARSTLAYVAETRAAVGDQMAALGIKMEDVASDVGRDWPGVNNSLLRDEDEREQLQKQAAQVAALQASGQAPALDQTALPGLPTA